MWNVSTRSLRILAALIWYVGGMVLLLKARSLLAEAKALQPDLIWPWLAAVAGVFLGGIKAKLVFRKACSRNLERIATLDRPRIWQFYSLKFLLALTVMILAGVTLSRLAHGNYPFLMGVAMLDFGIGIALVGSGHLYWRQGAGAR